MDEVGIVLLGFGQMGSRALATLMKMRQDLLREGVDIRIRAIFDQDPQRRQLAREFCRANLIHPSFQGEVKHDLPGFVGGLGELERARTLVYDATASHEHLANMLLCHRMRIRYFGEKPMVVKQNELTILQEQLKDRQFWCDLIETESRVSKTAVGYIIDNKLAVRQMRFWRLGSTGLKKICELGARSGVTGGALEDKVPHDLSLTIALLEATGVNTDNPPTVVNSEPSYFLLANMASIFDLDPDKAEFMAAAPSGSQTGTADHIDKDEFGRDLLRAADARWKATLQWTPEGAEPVLITYDSSWIGMSDNEEVEREMQTAGVDKDQWYFEEDVRSISPKIEGEFKIKECRVAILDCVSRNRGKAEDSGVRVICNFLPRPSLRGKPAVAPWIRIQRERSRKSRPLLLDPQVPYGEDTFARVFQKVIRSFRNKERVPHLEGPAVLGVHRIMLQILEKGMDQVRDKQKNRRAWVQDAQQDLQNKIRDVRPQ